jgi:hypothetical protein
MKTSTSDKHAAANKEMRELYGDQMSHSQLAEYKALTGIDALWIRRGSTCIKLGRGLYQIPGGNAVKVATSAPILPPPSPSQRKFAKAKKSDTPTPRKSKKDRVVIPTPFDDGAYDAPAKGTDNDEDGTAPIIDAPVGYYRPEPLMIHAWVCKASRTTHCPGRKPGSFYGPDNAAPKCECGSEMARHSWEKKQ